MNMEPISTFLFQNQIFLIYKKKGISKDVLHALVEVDGRFPDKNGKKISIKIGGKTEEDISKCREFRVSSEGDLCVMTYLRKDAGEKILVIAASSNALDWQVLSETSSTDGEPAIFSPIREGGQFGLFYGTKKINLATSDTLEHWKPKRKTVLSVKDDPLKSFGIAPIAVIPISSGHLLIYDATMPERKICRLRAGAILLDYNNPTSILWSSKKPLWEQVLPANLSCAPLGVIRRGVEIILQYATKDGDILSLPTKLPFDSAVASGGTPTFKQYIKTRLDQTEGKKKIGRPAKNESMLSELSLFERTDKTGKKTFYPLGSLSHGKKIYILARETKKYTDRLVYYVSRDGKNFRRSPKKVTLEHPSGTSEGVKGIGRVNFSEHNGEVYVNYEITRAGETYCRRAVARRGIYKFIVKGASGTSCMCLSPVSEYVFDGEHIGYYGECSIGLARSLDFKGWNMEGSPLLTPRGHTHWDSCAPPITEWACTVIGTAKTEEGIVVLYDSSHRGDEGYILQVATAVFDPNDPAKLLYRSEEPIAKDIFRGEFGEKPMRAIGLIRREDDFLVYFAGRDGELYMIPTPHPLARLSVSIESAHLNKYLGNPIIKPDTQYTWESRATFNPAAVLLDGKVHLLYRAHGPAGHSDVGYAVSADGYKF